MENQIGTRAGDPWVEKVQKWLNATYQKNLAFGFVPEDGKTGWPTIYGLIRAVQIELGITFIANNFGPTTQEKWDQTVPSLLKEGKKHKLIKLIDGALICKGLGTGKFGEAFDVETDYGIKQFKSLAGFDTPSGALSAMWAKALFDMSAFKRVYGGSEKVQEVQRYLNRLYHPYTGILPCDGIYQRDTNKALIYGLQAEMGMNTSTANGYFGNGTTSLCPTLSASQGTSRNIALLQAALIVNEEYSGNIDGVWNSAVTAAVTNYKSFMKLNPVNGVANMPVIKALLTTTGDINRDAKACDTSYQILTQGQVNVLKSEGYNTIGRYLTGTVGVGASERPKNLTVKEINLLKTNNFSIFPIYQQGGGAIGYFARGGQGISDAKRAGATAKSLGFKQGTTIYFACDFDVMGHEIPTIISYMRDVVDTLQAYYPQYSASLYAPRNVCTQVMDSIVQVQNCFVSDMSSGFSANLGYKMPRNWSFDQFFEYSVGGLDIDKVGMSGYWDSGQKSFNPPAPNEEILMELKAADQTTIAKNIGDRLKLFKDIVTVGFGSEIEQEARVGDFVVKLKIGNEMEFFSGNITKFNITNGKISAKLQEELDSFQKVFDFSGSQAEAVVETVNALASICDQGEMQVALDIDSGGAIGIVMKSTGTSTVTTAEGVEVAYTYGVTLGVYFDPRNIPSGVIPQLDEYRIKVKQFQNNAIIAVGTSAGLVLLGGLIGAGVPIVSGISGGLASAGAVLTSLIALVSKPFKN
ncbi:DUF1906 domain-containing protein [Enterococcus hulanensis]|uniref:glycoside hydrolase domain-containing protein n=1 Tax=Enterococcus hulanensis TaxID=2559929 RepID=UPI00288FA1AB|nr:glycoside hydrolase domain-containing protein [Enterococcus hulanensis]MDT2660503.1 DUF1906 domain-containing protein [Enterococcus hulanensis]